MPKSKVILLLRDLDQESHQIALFTCDVSCYVNIATVQNIYFPSAAVLILNFPALTNQPTEHKYLTFFVFKTTDVTGKQSDLMGLLV